jgi:glycine betaine/proline transport system substrate-binding protein
VPNDKLNSNLEYILEMNMKTKSIKLIAIVGVLLIGLTLVFAAGCGGSKQGGQKTVKLVYVNWAEGIAMTNLAKVILEDQMHYKVDLKVADVGPVYTSIAKGDEDAFLDAWLPVTHASYMEKYGSQIDDYGIDYAGARIGLVVPDYVTIDSITQMNAHKDQFKKEIIGIDAGAGIMKATDSAIAAYDLDFTLIPSSGPAMTAALKNAVENDKWVVITGWKPHWMWARWKLKFLEDPKGVYGKTENIHVLARKGLDKDMPRVAQFLKNFKMDDQQLGSLEGMINEEKSGDPAVAARAWVTQNMDLVKSWIPKE